MTSCRRDPLLMRWMMYSRTFSSRSVWLILCSGGSGSLLQPENAQERSVLTGGHERRPASDARGAECLLSPIVRQQPPDHGPEAVSKEERGQEASVYRPFSAVLCFLAVRPLAHLGPIRLRKGVGDFGPGRTPE